MGMATAVDGSIVIVIDTCLLFTAVELQLAELQTCAQTLNKGL